MLGVSLIIIAAAIVYMVETYISTYYTIEYMHGTSLFLILLAKYGTPVIFVLTDGDSNTGYKFSETKDIIAGMNIPIYTISYNYAADSLSELASINEAASIVGNSEDITYKLRNLFNAEM